MADAPLAFPALALERLPTLRSARLRLRWLETRDLPDLFSVFSDPEVARYTSRPPQRDLSDTRVLLEDIHAWYRDRAGCQWGLATVDDDRVIGTVSLFHLDEAQGRGEVGYALRRSAWGQGYVHEALEAVLAFSFLTLGLRRLEADVDPRNQRSVRVLERLGFVREGLLRERWLVAGELQDALLYGLLGREWQTTAHATLALRRDDG